MGTVDAGRGPSRAGCQPKPVAGDAEGKGMSLFL